MAAPSPAGLLAQITVLARTCWQSRCPRQVRLTAATTRTMVTTKKHARA